MLEKKLWKSLVLKLNNIKYWVGYIVGKKNKYNPVKGVNQQFFLGNCHLNECQNHICYSLLYDKRTIGWVFQHVTTEMTKLNYYNL